MSVEQNKATIRRVIDELRKGNLDALEIGIGRTELEEVDRLNVYWAAMETRRRAVQALPTKPAHILVDGKRRIVDCRVPQTAMVDGDALSASIAAASIVATVTRA